MLELCGARLLEGTIDVGGEGPPAKVIRLRDARVRAILGISVASERQSEILRALDFRTRASGEGLEVTVPALRRDDVTREIDLIEEVARIDGVDRLPATLPARRGAAGILSHAQRVRRAAEDALVGRGLYEIVGWSFADPGLLDRLRLPAGHPMRDVIEIENPLSDAQSILRPSLLGSLLDAARHNAARDRADIRIFESGTVYRVAPEGPLADEHHALGALLSGRLVPPSWRGDPQEVDFFAAKALLGAVLERLGVSWSVEPADWPFLHPGRSAAVLAGGERLGFLGELHPLVAGAWDLGRTVAFAVDVGKLAAAAPPVVAFRAFPAVPSMRRDLAVVLPEEVSASETIERVRSAAGEMLDDVGVFDVYSGEQIGEGRRSLALSLSFGSADRTLTDEDIAPVRARILEALGELGGELRG
jgi:phenylalanyl-tRNA synthetase beta chain